MIYTKETAMERARELHRRIREKTEPFDPEAELAAELLEAQAVVVECVRDSAVLVGDHKLMRRDDAAARLRKEAAELREG